MHDVSAKERYVRFRLGLQAAFGSETAEEDIERGTPASAPDTWDSTGCRQAVADRGGDWTRVLGQCATTRNLNLPGLFETDATGVMPALARQLDGSILYGSAAGRIMIVIGRGGELTIQGGFNEPVAIVRRTTAEDVRLVLTEEAALGLARKHQALAWLREAYRPSLRRAREEAERAFDAAVAVSDDGRTIETADWVVVLPSEPAAPAARHPADAFRAYKARLHPPRGEKTPGLLREEFRMPEDLPAHGTSRLAGIDDPRILDAVAGEQAHRLETALREGRPDRMVQYLMVINLRDDAQAARRILFVAAADCPHPLPEGRPMLFP